MIPVDARERSDASKIYFDLVDEETGELLSPSMTKTNFTQECDVNYIMSRYIRDGIVTHVNSHEGSYGDFSHVSDYQSALNAVLDAQESFMTLPASVRERFANDPGEFLKFAEDPANLDEMVDMGLATYPESAIVSTETKSEPTASDAA